jgi:hypothetical protein
VDYLHLDRFPSDLTKDGVGRCYSLTSPHWTEHSSLFNLGVRIHTKSSLFDESIPRSGLLLPKTHLDIAEVTSRIVTISRHEAKKTSTLLRQFSRTVLS